MDSSGKVVVIGFWIVPDDPHVPLAVEMKKDGEKPVNHSCHFGLLAVLAPRSHPRGYAFRC
jgi:hypothetical protein